MFWSAKYLAGHWDEMNSGAQKYGGALLSLRELQSAHKMKNHIGSERKRTESQSANRVLLHFLNFFSNNVLDSYFSFSFDDVKLHFLERKEKHLKLFSISKQKNHLWIFNFRIESIFSIYQNFLGSEFWADNSTENHFS